MVITLKLGFVVSELNADFVDRMLLAAKKAALSLGIEVTYITSVLGCYDAPFDCEGVIVKG
jgi:6,7-dimethyl-8-ribityllumazine synthase